MARHIRQSPVSCVPTTYGCDRNLDKQGDFKAEVINTVCAGRAARVHDECRRSNVQYGFTGTAHTNIIT